MADIKLTRSQQAVVEDRGGALLVSAAAGSGKTKVLIDRLLSQICDPIAPRNIDDFLVITYTNAAAAELRLKIAQALSKKIAEQPDHRHLQRQMRRIYLAEISTVHAFCSNLLRKYAHILDIPGDFRMIEEAEAQVLQKKVLDTLLEQGYSEGSADFRLMVETFGYGRDDRRLPEAVLMAHKAMRCRADMRRWLEETTSVLDVSQYRDIAQTPWGSYVVCEFHGFLERQVERLRDAVREMQYYPKIEKSYADTFRENILQLEQLQMYHTWDEIVSNQIDSFGKLKALREPEDISVKERLGNLRKKCWSDLQKWQQFFYAPSQELLDDLAQVMPGAAALLRFTQVFDKAYSAEKERRKLLDFSDLEHLAIRLLTDRYTGKPTAIAKEVAARYVEIMVDEYQDSNQVQEVIFEAISQNGKNRFMVGDVKQSIYRFRLADPTLFLEKYETYPNYQFAETDGPRKIMLSENFRSRAEILEACNDVFRLIMRKQVGDLDYGEEEALKPGREFPTLPQKAVELHCLTSSDQESGLDKRELEADFVAARIRRLLDEKTLITDRETLRPAKPSDIVILMRSVSNNAQIYLQALERNGVSGICNQGGSLLDTTEVQVLVAMLQIIDNPHQDIPLLTVLASPVFGISPDELARVRMNNRKSDFYDAMKSDERFAGFVQLLDELRGQAPWLPLHELVEQVLYKSKMLHIFAAMTDGEQREKNLLSFSSFVVGFENGEPKALSQLLWYLANLQESGGQLPVPQSTAENAVTIMSIHKSKGLEFPIVFICDLSRQFNMRDMQDAILVDDVLAVGCNRVDTSRFIRYPTLAKKSIEHKKRKESISEELRVLYVAMTRPKDMLIMTYYSKRLLRELEVLNSQLTMPLSDDLCASVNNPGKWLLIAALCRTEAGELLTQIGGNDVASVSKYPWLIQYHDLIAGTDVMNVKAPEAVKQMATDEEWAEILQHDYAYAKVCDLPAKLTATQLKGRIQDQEAAHGAIELIRPKSYSFRKASFLPHKLTAAEKGIATHLFMQFAVYEKCLTQEMVEEELERLCAACFLTREQAQAVQTEKIVTFFCSQTGTWLLSQRGLHREFKFSLLVDAKEYFPEAFGEEIMLQGVVDCFVIEPDGITILDFKTDHVDRNVMERAEYYRSQLDAYGKALARIYAKPIKRKILYFFSVDTAVEL